MMLLVGNRSAFAVMKFRTEEGLCAAAAVNTTALGKGYSIVRGGGGGGAVRHYWGQLLEGRGGRISKPRTGGRGGGAGIFLVTGPSYDVNSNSSFSKRAPL